MEGMEMMEMAVAVMIEAVAVYRRGRWFVSSISEVRIMWNITTRVKNPFGQIQYKLFFIMFFMNFCMSDLYLRY
jgi:hypothetical protein